jgi:hypothetical protein
MVVRVLLLLFLELLQLTLAVVVAVELIPQWVPQLLAPVELVEPVEVVLAGVREVLIPELRELLILEAEVVAVLITTTPLMVGLRAVAVLSLFVIHPHTNLPHLQQAHRQ